MLENIRLSFKGIWSHKLRAFLTMLGIIVGIAAVISVVSTITGANEQIKNNLIGDGTNTVVVQLYQDNYPMDFTYETPPANVFEFPSSLREELLEIDSVTDATLVHTRNYVDNLFYKNNNLSGAMVYGIDKNFLHTMGLQVTAGRGFTEKELDGTHKVALIDKTAYQYSFEGNDAIGATLDINGESFTVIGVVEKKSKFEPVINSIDDYYTYNQQTNGTVYIPDKIWAMCFRYDEPHTVIVQASSTDNMPEAGQKTAQYLNDYLALGNESPYKYQGINLASNASELQQLTSSTNILLIGIASISLLVGGIGVMNIMLVSVTERTREIGLKKALGAKKRSIRTQFLTEAVLLSGMGGILGVIVGIVLAKVISVIAMIPTAISIPAIIIAVVFSMIIGIAFGLAPSVKASKLNPIDALRYE